MTEPVAAQFRRFKDGDNAPPPWSRKVVTSGQSYKCPTYVHRAPPCQASCPSGHDVRGWLAIARGMDKPPRDDMPWQAYAFERLVAANPFPSIMGRVCPAPCEDACNRNGVDDFVGINAVEQHLGDWALENDLRLPGPGADTGKRVAVIGGGPAGLAATMFLRRKGHGVTIFESREELGGMLRYGLPDYRTPRAIVTAEIQRIVDLGVELRTMTRVGTDIGIAELERDFDAIFWAMGAQTGRTLPIPGSDAPNCVSGIDFLDAFNVGKLTYVTERMVVVGGGDTSIDVASVARRLGHIIQAGDVPTPDSVIHGQAARDVPATGRRQHVEAVLTSLFPIETMTATEREREDAVTEGVDIRAGVMPVEVLKDDAGRARALRMCQCDMDGMTPIPRAGTEFEIACDLVVIAIGQMVDFTGLGDLGRGDDFIGADGRCRVTGREKHFAGGDVVSPRLLPTAIGHGFIATESIDAYLSGAEPSARPKVDVHHFNMMNELRRHDLGPEEYDHRSMRGTSASNVAIHNYEDRAFREIIAQSALSWGYFPVTARNERREFPVRGDAVLGNYDERMAGFTAEQAVAEGERCMSCGLCVECNECLVYCPQDAIFRVNKDDGAVGRYVDTDYAKCVGCHICMDVCPAGYIQMGLGE